MGLFANFNSTSENDYRKLPSDVLIRHGVSSRFLVHHVIHELGARL